MKKLSIFLFLIAVIFSLSFWSMGPCDSPYVGGHTGAPGETGCNGCHGGTPNTGPGILTLAWADTTGHYVPGQLYDAVVTLEQAARDKFGFVALALEDNGNSSTGQFSIDDTDRTRTYSDGPRKYVSHTPCGADAVPPGSLSWTFHWEAPATDVGPVTIYLAGLAADHSHNTFGDDSYEFVLHLSPVDTVTSMKGERLENMRFTLYPNPASAGESLNVRILLPHDGRLQFHLLDYAGHTFRSFDIGENTMREQNVMLDIAGVTSGVYMLKSTLDEKTIGLKKVVIVY